MEIIPALVADGVTGCLSAPRREGTDHLSDRIAVIDKVSWPPNRHRGRTLEIMASARQEGDPGWLRQDGVPYAYLPVPATSVRGTRRVLSALQNVLPSPGLVAWVVVGLVALPFLIIFVIASVGSMLTGGLGW
jgi:hypothetical protein